MPSYPSLNSINMLSCKSVAGPNSHCLCNCMNVMQGVTDKSASMPNKPPIDK